MVIKDPICHQIKICIDDLIRGDDDALVRFLEIENRYFKETNNDFAWRYFTRLGGYITHEFFPHLEHEYHNKQSRAKALFRNFALKADFLPWFSEKAKDIDPVLVAASFDAAIKEYRYLIMSLLSELRPKWIQCNGLQMVRGNPRSAPLAEEFFQTKLTNVHAKNTTQPVFCGRVALDCGASSYSVPIMVHRFINSKSGPSANDFTHMAAAFRLWVEETGGDDAAFDMPLS